MEWHDDYMKISEIGWKMMFDHVLDPTIEHVNRLLKEPKMMRNCKYLCLAGGLSTSLYFQSRMEQEFGVRSKYNLELIIPKRPILSVVEGAAYFAITPNYIKARILKYTYGEMVAMSMISAALHDIPQEWIEEHQYCRNDEVRVSNCFDVIATKGQEIRIGEIIKNHTRRRTDQMAAGTRIYVSKMKDPKVQTDGKELGYIRTVFDNNDEDDTGITLEFHFYETVIKAVVYKDKYPDEKQIHYINNYE